MPADEWRARLAGAYQDFFRFELRAGQTVGLGDVPRIDDVPAVTAAVGRAGADDVVEHLVAGLDTQLGTGWPDGVEVSFGQWQKLALARGFMRDDPLLLVLDEPTAALDAETEHALFERYAESARERLRPTAASRCWCRTASAPSAWPTSSSCSTAPAWSRWAPTRTSWPTAGPYSELYRDPGRRLPVGSARDRPHRARLRSRSGGRRSCATGCTGHPCWRGPGTGTTRRPATRSSSSPTRRPASGSSSRAAPASTRRAAPLRG